MTSHATSNASRGRVSLTSLPLELIHPTVAALDYHGLLDLRATCRTFGNVVTPDLLIRKKVSKREELKEKEQELTGALHRLGRMGREQRLRFAYPGLVCADGSNVSFLPTLRLACYGCVREKSIVHFKAHLFQTLGRDPNLGTPIRLCQDCEMFCRGEEKYSSCDQCGSIGHAYCLFAALYAEREKRPWTGQLQVSPNATYRCVSDTHTKLVLCEPCHRLGWERRSPKDVEDYLQGAPSPIFRLDEMDNYQMFRLKEMDSYRSWQDNRKTNLIPASRETPRLGEIDM